MHSRIFYLFLTLFLLIQACVVAQSNAESYNLNSDTLSIKGDSLVAQDSLVGKLSIIQDNRVNKLLMLDLLKKSRKQGFNGYRIQIYSESSIDTTIEQAQAFQSTFTERFPDLRVYLNYYDPDFKIRVGNFRGKVECEGILRKIKREYPNCYTVRTFIYFKDLIPLISEESILQDSLDNEGK